MEAVLKAIGKKMSEGNLLFVVFVHGWKHSAAPNDEFVKAFRKVIMWLSEEHRDATLHLQQMPPSETEVPAVVGLYLGWRGRTITVSGIENLDYYGRKRTAHEVGSVGVAEVLAREKLIAA